MNAVTFNEPFLGLLGKEYLDCPLIDYSKSVFDIEGKAEIVVDFEKRTFKLPFQTFRVAVRVQSKSSNMLFMTYPVNASVEDQHGPGNMTVVFVYYPELRGISKKIFLAQYWLVECTNPNRKGMIIADCNTELREQLSLGDAKGFKVIPSEDGVEVLAAITTVMLNLCSDFNNPSLYLCKRLPSSPKGRSVEWQKAREHYVLIHKSHSANRKISAGIGPIHDGSTIDRVAHARRAHSRLLSSPRYKAKRGQRIWVQSAWVGPKEWSDHSGQIYKIVDRNKDGKIVLP